MTLAVQTPSSNLVRWCVVGGGVAGALGLLLMSRLQRVSSRALARTEERLRILELRSRDEGDDLHRRVIEAVTREGELRFAVDVLSMEIARLRSSLDGLVVPVVATLAELSAAPAESASTYDLPLVQAAFAAPVAPMTAPAPAPVQAPAAAVAEPEPYYVAEPRATELYAVTEPLAVDLWQPPMRPEPVPVSAEAAPDQVRSWVVRELHLDAEAEPVAALTMRILDLRTPAEESEQAATEEPEQPESVSTWAAFARPA